MDVHQEIKKSLAKLEDLAQQTKATIRHLGALLDTASQPLPNPNVASAGDDPPISKVRPRDHVHEVGSCICDTWRFPKKS